VSKPFIAPPLVELHRLIIGDGYTDDDLLETLGHLTVGEEGDDVRLSTAVFRRWLCSRDAVTELQTERDEALRSVLRKGAIVDALELIVARDHLPECAAVQQAQPCDCGHTETPEEVLADMQHTAKVKAMSDVQIDAELRAAGMDVEAEVRRCQAMVRVAIERNAVIRERDAVKAQLAAAMQALLQIAKTISVDVDEAALTPAVVLAIFAEYGRVREATNERVLDGLFDMEQACQSILKPILTAHPLPWRVEQDWTHEVIAADGYTVAKCMTASEAQLIVVEAVNVDRDATAALAAIDKEMEAP
jgi:stress response protein YsnF